MKKGISVLLALILCLGCFTGCVGSIDNSAYVPTGDALLMEGEDPAEETIAPDSQDLTLAYYPDRSMNPLYGRLPRQLSERGAVPVRGGLQEQYDPHSVLSVSGHPG